FPVNRTIELGVASECEQRFRFSSLETPSGRFHIDRHQVVIRRIEIQLTGIRAPDGVESPSMRDADLGSRIAGDSGNLLYIDLGGAGFSRGVCHPTAGGRQS